MRVLQIAGISLAAVATAVGVAALSSSCAATPTNLPVRSFQQAKNVDVVCVAVNDSQGNPLAIRAIHGLRQNECAQVPPNVNGSPFANHLFAVVTQSARGELAVVDLTAGNVVDQAAETPGLNFIPVGADPTAVVVAPEGEMTFVSSAAPNKPAIYAIPTAPTPIAGAGGGGAYGAGLLGDTYGATGTGQLVPLQLTSVLACALPQPPQSIFVASLPAPNGTPSGGYVIAAVLRPERGAVASVVAVDPAPLLRGGHVALDAGFSDAGASRPGVLAPCTILGATALSSALPNSWSPGPAWPDGVPYADAGDLSSQEPTLVGSNCSSGDAGAAPPLALAAGGSGASQPGYAAVRDDLPILYVGDAALPVIHVIDLRDPTHPRELPPLLATSFGQQARAVTVGALAISPVTRQYARYLYAVDAGDGSVMVFDVTDPALSPRTPMLRPHPELNPLAPRDRLVFPGPVATMAFVQHDWPLLKPTEPVRALQGVLCNPNPNAYPDAGEFADPGAYYRADQAGTIQTSGTVLGFPYRLRGVFALATLSNGQIFTVDVDDWDAPCRRPDPMAVGAVGPSGGATGLLDLPEPDAGPKGDPTFFDPYHAPFASNSMTSAVTQEAFFPVSAPHRIRSNYLLRNDPTSGDHAPNVLGTPALFDVNGAPVSTVVSSGAASPLILPTDLPPGFYDPTAIVDPTVLPFQQKSLPDAAIVPAVRGATPGVRLSFDDPTAAVDQDWSVTYEGALPTVPGLAADMRTSDGYESMILTIGQEPADGGVADGGYPLPALSPGFCERGVEDWTLGQERAVAALAEMANLHLPQPLDLPKWTGDYVELLDDLLPETDPYWTLPSKTAPGAGEPPVPVIDCWDGLSSGQGSLAGDPHAQPSLAANRYNACQQSFDAASTADTHLSRDFPIVHAYDDHLVLGRFGWTPVDPATKKTVSEQTSSRVFVGPDPSNRPFLQFAQCCFHKQATFKVRAGGQWLTVGQHVSMLHHVMAAAPGTDPSAPTSRPCVQSCDPHDALMNARSFDVPWASLGAATGTGASVLSCGFSPDAGANGVVVPKIGRNSPLALHNPFFSFVTWMGCGKGASDLDHTLTPRDYTWRFSYRGGFAPLVISLGGGVVSSVSPQSMRFIQSLGQLAIVDGAAQGLVLIDLNTLSFAHNPYY